MTARLVILGAAALIFMTLLTATLKYRGDAIGARAEAARVAAALQLAVDANKEQQKAYEALRRQAEADAALVAELQDELTTANASTLALAQKVADLKSGNPDVKTFLDMPVPTDLRGLYSHP